MQLPPTAAVHLAEPGREVRGRVAGMHAHDACGLAATVGTAQAGLVQQAQRARPLSAATDDHHRLHGQAPSFRWVIYRNAPKTSPPV